MAPLNILNVDRIEQTLLKSAAWCLDERCRRWFMTVARNRIVGGASQLDIDQNYIEWSPGCDLFAPTYEQLPAWAARAVKNEMPVHWFVASGYGRRMFWKALPAIAAWLNNFDPRDPVLNRLSRICFETAMSSAFTWRKEIDGNIWAYVKDKPKTLIRYDNGYRWVELVSALQFEREGNLMSHCVGNGTYYRKYAGQSGRYLSLRDPDNMPQITVELEANRLIQCKGRDNKKPKNEHQGMVSDLLSSMQLFVSGDAHMIDKIPS